MYSLNADLLDDLARQKVVLFLGAGVSASATTHGGGRIKGWEDFLRSLCSEVNSTTANQVGELLDKKDYLLACEILQKALSDSWERHVSQEFGQMAEPSQLHEAIVGLDQRIIITTNFDKLIEMSWGNKIGTSTHLPKIVPQIDANIFNLLKDHSGRYLVKIHGTVDNPDTLIFSRSEYIRLAFGNALYSSFLEMLLLNYTFVFIGFSMDDPAIGSLMEMYTLRYQKARPHYIFAPSGAPDNIIEINRRLRKLIVLPYDSANNHEQLPKIINEITGQVRVKRREIFAAALSSS